MAQLIFPPNPTDGQEYVGGNGITYVYKTNPGVWSSKIKEFPDYLGLFWTPYPIPEGGCWTKTPSLGAQPWAVRNWFADSSDTAICYISNSGKIYRSTDAKAWTQVYDTGQNPTTLPDWRLVAAGDGVWGFTSNTVNLRSLDDGLTWQPGSSYSYLSSDRWGTPGVLYGASTNTTNYTIVVLPKGSSTPTVYDTGIPKSAGDGSISFTLQGFSVSNSDSGPVYSFMTRQSGEVSTTIIRQSLSPTGPWESTSFYTMFEGYTNGLTPLPGGGCGAIVKTGESSTVTFQTAYTATPSQVGPWSINNQIPNIDLGWYTLGFSPKAALYNNSGLNNSRFGVLPQPAVFPYVSQTVSAGQGPCVPFKGYWVYFSNSPVTYHQS
jgi:hypothetical protein